MSPLETFFPHDQHFPIYGHPVEIIVSVVIQISHPSYDPLPLSQIYLRPCKSCHHTLEKVILSPPYSPIPITPVNVLVP